MSTLHLVFTAPTAGSALADCLRAAAGGDTLLLVQDGVHAILQPPAPPTGLQICALHADVAARGLAMLTPSGIAVVDDAGFVELTERHVRVVSWF